MSSDPDRQKSSSLFERISIIGFLIGISAVFSQINSWRSFTSLGNNTFSETSIGLFIIGIFLIIVSYFSFRSSKYGREGLVNPELTSALPGNASPTITVLMAMIILFNALAIWTVFALYVSGSWFFKTFDIMGLYLVLGFWGMMDLILVFFYHSQRAKERHESVSPEHVRKIVDFGGVILALIIICVIMWCVNHVPASAALAWFGLVLAIGASAYGVFIIHQAVYTGQWRVVPPILEEYKEKIWDDYGGLVIFAVILNGFIFIIFFLIVTHVIPIDWGNQFGLWFICSLGAVNMIILLAAILISEQREKERLDN